MSFSTINPLVIDHTQVGATDRTNFVLKVAGQYTWAASVANGGVVQSASGFDIWFCSDSGATTKLNWEKIYWDANGNIEFNVLVPTVSHTTNTTIYVGVGDATVTTDSSNATGTWPTTVAVAINMGGDGVTLTVNDSTVNANNATNTGWTASAFPQVKVGKGGGANPGSGKYLSIPGHPTGSAARTYSFWYRCNTPYPGTTNVIFDQWTGTGTNRLLFYAPNNNIIQLSTNTGSQVFGNSRIWDSSWHHVAIVVTAGANIATANQVMFYLDGVLQVATQLNGSEVLATNTGTLTLGTNADGKTLSTLSYFDEYRCYNVALSQDEITAIYNNQVGPNAFYSLTGSKGAVLVTKLNAYAVVQPPQGVSSSKVNAYAVLQAPLGISVSKTNAYVVLGASIAPSWPGSTMGTGAVGIAYSQTLAANGSQPLTYALLSGALPNGLTLTGATVAGTPTVAGTFNFTIRASNTYGSADMPFTMSTIQPPAQGGSYAFVV